jgi:AAA+ ATPase superfamily predicted ATPase
MFIGRSNELSTLDAAWRRDDFQFIVLYGRRRVGKSTLLTHFAQGKRSLYHLAQETSPKVALEQFSRSIGSFMGREGIAFRDWDAAFDAIAKEAKNERLLLIIDEFPYMAESSPSLLSLMQNAIDTKLKNTALCLILCGSTMAFMEREVLGAKSPLFGRRTKQMRLEPFGYEESAEFVPDYTNVDKALTYGVFGGVPHYLSKLDPQRSLLGNIEDSILEPNSYLYDEPVLLLKQELREPAIYNAVIEAIAAGASRLNDIATRVGEDAAKCGKYLQALMDLGFVLRETPIGSKPGGRRTLYALSDPFFSFWYSFVFSNRSILEQGMSNFVLESEIMPRLNHYMGKQFERICIEFLYRRNRERKLPFVFTQAGRWWGTDNQRRRQVELDIVAIGKDEALICECKWTNDALDMQVLNELLEDSAAFACEKKHYVLFCKSGFTPAVTKAALDSGILLFSLDDLFGMSTNDCDR